jgi:glyoxylase-like metal-dependent hydrolase (beta-lactamase superfamily II)
VPHEPAIRVGGVEVVPLCDGWAPLPLDTECPGRSVDWEAERARFPWAFAGEGAWAWHVHAFLLRTADGAVLVDTGIGSLGRPPYDVVGRIRDELRSADVATEDVRHVIHTHLHADHAGAACGPDGSATFPNAMHSVHPADWTFFEQADDEEDFQGRSAMTGLRDAGSVDLRPHDRQVVPGVRVLHSPGHTPGHRSVLLDGDGDRLLLTGDLLHLPLQVAHPDWDSSHDVDPMLGVASRRRLLFRAENEGWRMGVSHFAKPFGSVGPGGWHPAGQGSRTPGASAAGSE